MSSTSVRSGFSLPVLLCSDRWEEKRWKEEK